MRSGRHAGRIFVPKGFFAIILCQLRSSSGSSVVQTTLTFDFFMSPCAEKPFDFSFALHFFQMRSADAPQSRSFTPK